MSDVDENGDLTLDGDIVLTTTLERFGLPARYIDPATAAFLAAQQAMVTCDPRTKKLKEDLAVTADLPLPDSLRARVCSLILGESGTGKELCAKILHGKRPGQFVSVNMSAIPHDLFEAELFGSNRGSFTGSVRDTEGYFVAAKNGTLFLDEIGDLPLSQQAKLLRAIETRCVTPIGGRVPIPITCQLVFATNMNLSNRAELGLFREDLYYRINTVEFQTIPLRERPDDVPLILQDFRRNNGLTDDGSVPDLDVYKRGNVRALLSWAIRREIGLC